MDSTKYDLWKTCRTCLKSSKPKDSHILWSFFEFNNSNSEFPHCITYELALMKLKISANDGLPQQICKDCTERLKEFRTFRTKSKRSQEILQQYFNKLKPAAKVVELIEEYSQMPKIHTNFEFVDPNVKDEFITDDDTNCYNNVVSNLSDSYITNNNNNNKDKVTMDSFNQNNNEIKNSSMQCLKQIEIVNEKLAIKSLSHRNESVKYENNNHHQNLNKDKNNSILSSEEYFSDNDYDFDEHIAECPDERILCNKVVEKETDILKKNQLLTNDITNNETANVKDNQKIVYMGKFKTINDNPRPSRKFKKGVPKCRYCKVDFMDMHEMEEHVKNEHPIDRPHICPICKRGFKKASNRNIHLDTHIKESNFKCDECDSYCKSERSLRIHKQLKHRIGEHRCPFCGKYFIVKGLLKLHLKRKHSSSSTLEITKPITKKLLKKFKCNICEKMYTSPSSLKYHVRSHTGEKPYLCNACGKAFTIRSSLAIHYQIHENERKYKCPICDKSFNLRATLRTHKLAHSGLQPFQCEICKTKFTRKTSVNQHMKYKHKLNSPTTTFENT